MKYLKSSIVLMVFSACTCLLLIIETNLYTGNTFGAVLQSSPHVNIGNPKARRILNLTFDSKPTLPLFLHIHEDHIHTNSTESPKTNTQKLILFYNAPKWFMRGFGYLCSRAFSPTMYSSITCKCSQNPKDITKADAVIFNARDLRVPKPPKKRLQNQIWIFFGLEPPWKYKQSSVVRYPDWFKVFNWTMTYRLDSDIVAPYGVLYKKEEIGKTNFTFVASQKTSSALWLVSDCDTQSKRHRYVHHLQKHYNVTIYGRCGPDKKVVQGGFVTLQKRFRFYLAFENSICKDYVTEKLFKTYQDDVDIVPIVRGGANYTSMIPKGTFIDTADFASPKKLAEYLLYLEKNITAYIEILEKKAQFLWLGDKHSSPLCTICHKLNNLETFSHHYQNVSRWLRKDTCQEPRDIPR